MKDRTHNPLNRRTFLHGSLLTTGAFAASGIPLLAIAASSAPWRFDPERPIVPAPADPLLWLSFRKDLDAWRAAARAKLHYDEALYRKPEFAWASASFACCFLMMCDERFYDAQGGHYNVAALLEDGRVRFGGYDSVVLWHAYPRIGIDQRNQFDFYRDMPGGLNGVREVVSALHRKGVRVYIDYNPWDTGTRREGKPDLEMIAEMVGAMEVDGIFLDTMKEGAVELRQKLDAVRPGVILEGEATPPLDRVADHHASWAQWFTDSEAPGVLRLKWFERSHMQHQVSRWSYSHAAELQTAWMNGSGMMVWENVFGSLVEWNARDRSTLRSMLPIQRRYASLFRGEGWTPLIPTRRAHVYASLWTDGHTRLWTLINRSDEEVGGVLLEVDCVQGEHCYDLIAGTEIAIVKPSTRASLSATIAAHGIGCFLATTRQAIDAELHALLSSQGELSKRFERDATHSVSEIRLRPVSRTLLLKTAPEGMIALRARANQSLQIEMRVRECGYFEAGKEDEDSLRNSLRFQVRQFTRPLCANAFAIDEIPVTNRQYAAFLKAASYRPRHPENFLKHWKDGAMPKGKADHPVVWVDIDDARAFAAWSGKRLPTEDEWQFAAQGEEGAEYPWGNGLHAGVCNLGESGDTTPVRAFPAGRSHCGCYDMCGNIWQWTESERSDGRTRFSILRGGSYFCALGSGWYVDGGPRTCNFATKFLHMWPGLDRCATVGFRCVVDLESEAQIDLSMLSL